MTGLQFHALTVRDKRADTDDACVVGFDVPADLAATYRFEPGQWLTLRTVLQGEEVRRSYSICAAPGERLRVGVRRVPGGVFSNWLHDHLQPGDRIDVLPPQGRFGAALAPTGQQTPLPRHVLLVAGGSGITPMLSLLKTLLGHGGRTRCTLLYGNRSAASTMFKEEIEDLKNRHLTRLAVHPVFSREQVDTPLQAGHIDAEKLYAVLLLAGPVDAVFVCGPHAMNDAVEAALLGAGVAPECIHVERFGVPPAVAARPPVPQPGDVGTARIRIVRDGLTRELAYGPQDANILAAATRAGLDLPYSCRSGVCATCRAKLLDGRGRMDRTFALEPADAAAGFVLSCQAHPLTEVVTLSFDER